MDPFFGDLVELVLEEGNNPPEWVQLVYAGEVKSSRGDFINDGQAMDLAIAAFNRLGRDMVLDYEHQTLGGEWSSPDGTAPAAGWIKELKARDDGLWARVEWTQRGADLVLKKEYRYMSPVVVVRKSDRRLVAIHSVALTNDPAIVGMRPIANKRFPNKEEQDMDRKMLCELLGLKADAGDDDIVAALTGARELWDWVAAALALKAEELTAEALRGAARDHAEARRGLVEILGLKAEATHQDVLDAVKGLAEFHKGLIETLELSGDVELSDARAAVLALKNPAGHADAAELAELRRRLDEREAEEAVQEAMKAGKLTPANEDWAREQARKDPAAFKAFIAKAPVVVANGRVAGDGVPGGTSGGVDEVEQAVCKQLGLDVDTFKKHNPKEV